MKKYLYCPKCKKYPDNIIERYHSVDELREWNVDCYELQESTLDNPESIVCAECDTELESREAK